MPPWGVLPGSGITEGFLPDVISHLTSEDVSTVNFVLFLAYLALGYCIAKNVFNFADSDVSCVTMRISSDVSSCYLTVGLF